MAAAGDQTLFDARYGDLPDSETAIRDAILHFLTFDATSPNSILSCVTKARENARQVRGVLPLEAWEHLNRFYHMLVSPDARRRAAESPYDFYSGIRTASYLFDGILDATLSRGEESHFLRLGRHLERADQTSRILDVKYFILLPNPQDVGSVVDDLLWTALLHSVSGHEMFRRRHGRISPDRVVDFLVLDREFPRAVLYCLLRAEEALLAISGTPMGSFRNGAEKRIARLRSGLAYSTVEDIISRGLHEYLDDLQTGLNGVGEGILQPHLVRLCPRPDEFLRLDAHRLHLHPAPSALDEGPDAEGNRVSRATFSGMVSEFRVLAESTGETRARPAPRPHPALAGFPLAYADEALPPSLLAAWGVGPHTAAPVESSVADFAASAVRGAPDVHEGLANLAARLHTAVRDVPRLHGGPLAPAETLRAGQGACRDFAVLFMECCRSLGVASRFVSGYLPAANGLQQHMHAWAEVLLPGNGWYPYDPARGGVAGEEHIPVAASPAPSEAAPLAGAYLGASASTMHVELEVAVGAFSVP